MPNWRRYFSYPDDWQARDDIANTRVIVLIAYILAVN